jgi:NAD(P)H-hydrate epimerase
MTPIHVLTPQVAAAIPSLSVAEMVEVDRAMVEDFGILLLQMMEHAGRHLAHLARERFLAGDPRGRHVVVLAGTGGNGGGALVSARRLAGWGASVSVVVTAADDGFADVTRHQLTIARRLGLPVTRAGALAGTTAPDLIIDGVIGYGLRGSPHASAAQLIGWANEARAPVLALDVPSGLDSTTGAAGEPTIEATATMTLALPKQGVLEACARQFVGELFLADIGVPPALYARPPLGIAVPDVFATSDLVKLR